MALLVQACPDNCDLDQEISAEDERLRSIEGTVDPRAPVSAYEELPNTKSKRRRRSWDAETWLADPSRNIRGAMVTVQEHVITCSAPETAGLGTIGLLGAGAHVRIPQYEEPIPENVQLQESLNQIIELRHPVQKILSHARCKACQALARRLKVHPSQSDNIGKAWAQMAAASTGAAAEHVDLYPEAPADVLCIDTTLLTQSRTCLGDPRRAGLPSFYKLTLLPESCGPRFSLKWWMSFLRPSNPAPFRHDIWFIMNMVRADRFGSSKTEAGWQGETFPTFDIVVLRDPGAHEASEGVAEAVRHVVQHPNYCKWVETHEAWATTE